MHRFIDCPRCQLLIAASRDQSIAFCPWCLAVVSLPTPLVSRSGLIMACTSSLMIAIAPLLLDVGVAAFVWYTVATQLMNGMTVSLILETMRARHRADMGEWQKFADVQTSIARRMRSRLERMQGDGF